MLSRVFDVRIFFLDHGSQKTTADSREVGSLALWCDA